MPKRVKNEICFFGESISRFGYVTESAQRVLGAIPINDVVPECAPDIARLCFAYGESMWDELCKRFPDDDDEAERLSG